MDEIVSVGGKSFQIWYESMEDREYALMDLQNHELQANSSVELSLASTCPTAPKVLGQTITMTSNPSGGTAPYSYSFFKMLPGTTTPIWLGTQKQASNTLTYTTIAEDQTNISGQLKVGVIAYDSCPTGSLSNEESCYVNVGPACAAPTANLTIT